MICTNCEMVNQLPGTKCAHCGKLIPEPKPMTMEKTEADDGPGETETDPQASTVDDSEQGQTEGTDTAEAEVTPQKGHVDNVGDETEKETIVP